MKAFCDPAFVVAADRVVGRKPGRRARPCRAQTRLLAEDVDLMLVDADNRRAL